MSFSAGIFGGSFDPVHNGHIKYAEEMCSKFGLSEMIIVPAALSPFKSSSSASEEDRLTMCRLAFSGEKYLVTDMEMKRGGKSYTVDTVKEIREKYPDAELFMFVGSDQFLKFSKWYRFQEILKDVTLCTVSRAETDSREEMEKYADENLRQYGKCVVSDFRPFEISSSEIRQLLYEGGDASRFIPSAVNSYIIEKGLYRKCTEKKN